MKRALLAFVAPLVGLVAVLTMVATPAVAGAQGQSNWLEHSAWQAGSWRGYEPDLSLVHGVPGLNVDIYVYKNIFSVKKLTDVTFGTVADLDAAFPGWVTPGFYVVDVVATGDQPVPPPPRNHGVPRLGQNKTVAAYVTASPSGSPGAATLASFSNDVSSTAEPPG